jgi:hypothetical protein
MNDLIQSLPPPSAYNRNYSHMDEGIMDSRWRDIGDDDGDGDDDGETSVAMQGARTEFLVPNHGI